MEVSFSKVKNTVEYMGGLIEKIKTESNLFNQATQGLFSGNREPEILKNMGPYVREFLDLEAKLNKIFLQQFESNSEIQIKIRDLPKPEYIKDYCEPNLLREAFLTILKATIVLIPVYLWLEKKKNKYIDDLVFELEEIFSTYSEIVFEIENPNLMNKSNEV